MDQVFLPFSFFGYQRNKSKKVKTNNLPWRLLRMTNGYQMNAVSSKAAAKPSAQVKPKITVSLRLSRERSSGFEPLDIFRAF